MTGIVFIMYTTLFVIAVFFLIKQYKRNNVINAFICFQFAFIIYYILVPIVSHLVIEFAPDQLTGFIYRISNATNQDIFYAFFYTVIAYFIIITVYQVKISRTNFQKIKRINVNIESSNNENINGKLNIKIYYTALIVGIISLILGLFGEVTISNSLNGVINAIKMGDQLRAYGSDSSAYIPQNKLFNIVLMVSSLASTYFFVYAVRIKKNLINIILLFISILASIFYLLINAGRLGILLFLITFFADYAFRKFKHPFIFLIGFSFFGIFLLGLLDDWFFYLSYGYVKESSNSISTIINEFAFPYLNILNVHHINVEYGLRWGIDYFTWVINIIPTSILNLFGLSKVTTGYEYITEYYMGQNATGGIPTDIITLGMRQFGFLGLILISIFISIICKYFDKVLNRIHSNKYYFMTLRIALIMFVVVPYADLDSFVRNRYDMFFLLIFSIYIYFIQKKYKKNKLQNKL